jgi:exonuclease SbcC
MKQFELISIQLENIKSYKYEKIDFIKGHNVILGENGAGKSTILESLFLSLFGNTVHGRRLAEMIRQGEKQARIITTFTVNDEKYRIEDEIVKRGEDTATQTIVLVHQENGTLIAEGKRAVETKMEELLKVDSTTFNSAIYATQGEIGDILTATKTDRKKLFDRLFQLDKYEQAYKNLRLLEKVVDKKISGDKNTIETLEDDVKEFPKKQKQLEEKEKELKDRKKALEKIEKVFSTIQEKYNKIHNQIETYSSLQGEKNSLVKYIKEKNDEKNDLIKKLSKKYQFEKEVSEKILNQQIKQNTKEITKLKEDTEKINETINEIKEIRTKIDNLEEGIKTHQNYKSKLEKDITNKKTEIKEIFPKLPKNIQHWEEKIKEFIRKWKEKTEKLNGEIDKIQEKENKMVELRSKFNSKKDLLNSSKEKITTLEKELENKTSQWKEQFDEYGAIAFNKIIKKKEEQLKRIRDEIGETDREATEITTQSSKKEKDLQHIHDLKGKETCPTCKQSLTSKQVKDLEKELEQSIDNLKEQLEKLQSKEEALKEQLEAVKEELQQVREKERLFSFLKPKVKALKEEKNELKTIKKQQEEIKSQLNEFEDKKYSQTKKELANKLEEVKEMLVKGDQILQSGLPELQQKNKDVREVEQKISTNKEEISKLREALPEKKEEQLEKEMKTIEETIEHLENKQELMDDLLECNKTLEEYNSDFEQLEQKIEAIENIEGFKNREEIRKNWEKHKSNLVSKKTELESLKKEILPPLRSQVKDLQEKQNKYENIIKDFKLEKKKREAVIFLRWLMRALPERLLPNYLQKISDGATELLRTLIPTDGLQGVILNSDYTIEINRYGTYESVNVLSGGETIAVALAIRFAFAKEFSNMNLLVLDEPTIFLDNQRREELVNLLEKHRLVEQLFVVTHDDNFERIADKTFYVQKSRGESRIE